MKQKLPNPNPYDVLNVSQTASKTEITKAMKMAMVKKEYPLNVISQAHKSLLNPEERLIADYLRPILPEIKRFQRCDFSELEEMTEKLELLPEFDNVDQMLEDLKTISESDQKLGKILFSEPIL
jgi:hypothetical protein